METNLKVFIGGTGRSGTTIIGSCLEEIEDTIYFIEPGIICNACGAKALSENKTECIDFYRDITGRFNKKTIHGFTKLPHCRDYVLDKNTYSAQQVGEIIKRYENKFGEEAVLGIVRDFIDIGIKQFNAKNFIYKTPGLISCIDFLNKLYPDMYFIHMIREPKDIFESVITYPWGPKDGKSFVKWYIKNMVKAYNEYINYANERYIVVSLEDLVNTPILILSKILRLFGIDDIQTVLKCVKHINSTTSHVGRHETSSRKEAHALINRECLPVYESWKNVRMI